MRKVLIGFCCLLSGTIFGQNLHLDQTLYLSGDTIQGVAYFEEEALVPYAYHLSLFDKEGKAAFNKIIWAPSVGVSIFLPLSDELTSGKYTLQLSNYQNGMITHSQQVWVVNEERQDQLEQDPNPNQIGSVFKHGTALDVVLFDNIDSTKYTVQVLQDGIGDKPTELNSGESASFETRAGADLRVNVRNEQFRVFKVGEELSSREITLDAAQSGETMNLSLQFDQPMAQVSVSVTDLSQNPGKNVYPILPEDVKPTCKDLPNHARLNVGLKTWLRGFQLSGTLTSMEDGSQIEGQRLIMANPQDEFDLKYTATNDQGRFGFYNLDFEGTKTLYVTPTGENITAGNFEFSPARSFLVAPFPVCPSNYGTTSDELNEMVRLRLLNRKVAERFLLRRELPVRKPIYSAQLLFDDADQTVLMEDYVEFGTMKEVIKEIVPYVFITKKGIGVFSVDQKKSFQLKPLILINGVPIPDEEIIMDLQPEEIHSIQVLNKLSTIQPYGNLALGGIVSIVMNDRFDYPDELQRIDVEGYFKSKTPAVPMKYKGVPYFPAVVQWETDLAIDENNNGSVNFTLPDYETNVGIEVMGLTSTGRVITKYEVINLAAEPK